MKKYIAVAVLTGILISAVVLILHYGGGSPDIILGNSLTHPNGLTVKTPVSCQSKIVSNPEERLEICTGQRSQPIFVSISNKTDIRGFKRKTLSNGKTAYYRTSHSEASGSGGDEYSIFAGRQEGQRWIIMRRVKYAEFGHPGFDLEWAVFNSVTIKNPPEPDRKPAG